MENGNTQHFVKERYFTFDLFRRRDCCVDVWAADDLDYTKRIFIRINSLLGVEKNRRIPVVRIPYSSCMWCPFPFNKRCMM